MILASISARRLNRDPAPWVYADGTRHGQMAPPRDTPDGLRFDTDRYAPRAEYTPATAHPANPILDAARDTWDDGDPWGSALGWLSPVCALLDYLGEDVPAELGYRPSIAGSEADLTDGSWEATAVLEVVGLLSRDSDTTIGDGPIYVAGVGEVLGEDLDRATEYALHAMRVLNRIADAARAAGQDY